MNIDLNCDMGERIGNDEAIMPYITSANIACGFHAGDEGTMKQTVELCLEYNVAIGAHPSYPDKENFGRVDLMDTILKPEDLANIIAEQVNKLQMICQQYGTHLNHIKPHGALYNRAAWDLNVASIISSAILNLDAQLILYGLSGSKMATAAGTHKIKFMHEVFADRTYDDNGRLTQRTEANALIHDEALAVKQVQQMINEKTVTAVSGKVIPIQAETICIHGDGKHAVAFVKSISRILK